MIGGIRDWQNCGTLVAQACDHIHIAPSTIIRFVMDGLWSIKSNASDERQRAGAIKRNGVDEDFVLPYCAANFNWHFSQIFCRWQQLWVAPILNWSTSTTNTDLLIFLEKCNTNRATKGRYSMSIKRSFAHTNKQRNHIFQWIERVYAYL